MATKKVLTLEEVPYFHSVLTYATNHGNQYITPAHFMSALFTDYEVRKLFMKTFHVGNSEIFEITRGLFEYCENMKMAPLGNNRESGFHLSMEMYDFMDSYNREINKSKYMTVSAFFNSLWKSSLEICSIFEMVLDKSFDYIAKTLTSAEGNSNIFGMTIQEYSDYINWIEGITVDELTKIMSSLLEEDKLKELGLSDVQIHGVRRFGPSTDFCQALSNVSLAESMYVSLRETLSKENENQGVLVMSTGLTNLCLGYEEIHAMLNNTNHLNELDEMVELLSSNYDKLTEDSMDRVKQSIEDSKSVMKELEQKPEEAVVKKEVYMYGNEKLLDVAKDILVRLDNPNLLVLGDSGTGKTTFVNKIISMASNKEFSDIGLDLYPCTLDIQALNTKSKFRGEFETNFKRFVSEMVKKAEDANKKPLLIIEDINQTVPIGQTSGDITDAYLLMMSAMEKYHFPIIGTCTYDEYRQTILKKRRYNDKFTVVRLDEPNRDGVLTIMKEKGKELEKAYNQKIDDSTYTRVYDLANQFVRDKKYPAKALTLLNQTCAYSYTHKIENVTPECVEAVMERDYSVPSARLNTNLSESIKEIAHDVKSHVFGQDEAVDILVKYWKIKQAGLTKENKPIASLLFVGPTGVGKALVDDEFIPVYDSNGIIHKKRNGDLKVGDYVFDRQGHPTLITGVYPQGKCEVYEVELTDGRKLLCNKSHLWTCRNRSGNGSKYWKNMTTEELMNKLSVTKVQSGRNMADIKYVIPMNEPVMYTSKNYKLHPYVLGMALGNGLLLEKPFTISSGNEYVIEKVKGLIEADSYTRISNNNYSYVFATGRVASNGMKERVQTKDLFSEIPELLNKYSYEKFIPEIYKYGSIVQRWELIRGLFDADGSISKDNRYNISYSSTSYQLVLDIQEILYSLGISSTISEHKREKKSIEYDLHISCSAESKLNFFSVDSKLSRAKEAFKFESTKKRIKNYFVIGIRGIKKLDYEANMTCIMVDNQEHLYQAGSYIVTHNTELAKQFAKSIGYKLIRFDMSEYKEGHTISKLIGSPAGYVAHEEGGLLVNAIKSNPNCVLLLDEIEKAHSNIYDILLQIMDNAELTGNSGEKVDFQNVVLLMTSNCGARDAESARTLGFSNSDDVNNKLKAEIMQAELQRQFTPEFRGRLSAVVNFNSLSEKMCVQITDLRLKELEDSVRKTRENINLNFSDELKTHIVNKTLSEKAGGRSIEKFIDERIKDILLDKLLEYSSNDKVTINLDYKNNEIVTDVV